jgi:hypothetical protein
MIPKISLRQEKISNGLSIVFRLVAPISESGDLLLAASRRESSAHLSRDCREAERAVSVLNARDTSGERLKTMASDPIWRSRLGTKRSYSQAANPVAVGDLRAQEFWSCRPRMPLRC